MTARVNVKQGLAPAAAKARTRAYRIRIGIRSYIHTLGDIAAAYADEDWKALGYKSWAAYVEAEFGAKEVGLPPEQRQKAIEELRLGGMPNRAIAAALNVDEKTVRNDRAGAEYSAPIEGEIVSSPADSPIVDALKQAIEDADERNETAGLAGPAPDAEQASTASGTAAAGVDIPPAAAPDPSPSGLSGEEAGASAANNGAPAQDHPGTSSGDPGEAEPVRGVATEPGSAGVGSAPAPAAGGTASTVPPAAPTDEERTEESGSVCPTCLRPLHPMES